MTFSSFFLIFIGTIYILLIIYIYSKGKTPIIIRNLDSKSIRVINKKKLTKSNCLLYVF